MILQWVPALSRPELLAAPVRSALEGMGQLAGVDPATIEVAEIDPDLADTAVLTEAIGGELADMANCIVVAGARAGEERVCAALVLGHTRADVNKAIRKRLDVRKCSFMVMDEAVERTGMEYGGITPVGVPAEWPIWVDEAVADREWVCIGSGIRGSKLFVPTAELLRLPGAERVEGLAREVG